MAKIASGVLVLRNGKAQEWTSDVDKGFVAWINNYVGWLHTSPLALKEKNSTKYVLTSARKTRSMMLICILKPLATMGLIISHNSPLCRSWQATPLALKELSTSTSVAFSKVKSTAMGIRYLFPIKTKLDVLTA